LNREQLTKMMNLTKEMEQKIKFANELNFVKRQRIINNIEALKTELQLAIDQLE